MNPHRIAGMIATARARAARPKPAGRVYFVEAVGADRIKIGFTTSAAARRINGLQTASPFKLRIIGTVDGPAELERVFHAKWSAIRAVPGTEWFLATFELRRWIQDVLDGVPT